MSEPILTKGQHVIIFLKNSFKYEGIVLKTTDRFVLIKQTRGQSKSSNRIIFIDSIENIEVKKEGVDGDDTG